jgi:anti-anti-sigma factor
MITSHPPLEHFGVTVNFAGPGVVVDVRGEVDLMSAPELAAVLEAVIDRGHRSVVLDLAAQESIDTAGLRVIASGANRLGARGGELTIRSVPALVTRILGMTGLTGVIHFEPSEPALAHLGPRQPVAAPTAVVKADASDLAALVRRVTAIPVDHGVVDGALRLVVALAHTTVGSADGVSVSLQHRGRLATVAASDQTILDMDAYQYSTGEGPCVDASVEGRWFHVESLEQETRWPAFTPRAHNLGINAILSNPLLAGERPVGALNIYSRREAAFSAGDQELASIFATEASTILGNAAGISDEELHSQGDDRPLYQRAADVVDPIPQTRPAGVVVSNRRARPGLPIQRRGQPWPAF